MEVGHRFLVTCKYVLAFLLFTACSSPVEAPAAEAPLNVKETESIARIRAFTSPRFVVESVIPEEGAVRVNIRWNRPPDSESELKRAALNALLEIQTAAGKQVRLSVWCRDSDAEDISGYAFYSPLSDTYHFRLPGENQ